MATAESRRIPHGLAWGALGVFVWAAFSILIGGGAAHADETDSSEVELVSAVSSTLDDTVIPAAEPAVVKVAAPVVQNVAPVVQQVAPVVQKVAPPVVQNVVQKALTPAAQAGVAPAAQVTAVVAPAASGTAAGVVDHVTDVVQDSPLSGATTPVLSGASEVPVVGQLLDDVGLTTGVTAIVDTVDSAVGRLGDVVDRGLPGGDDLDPASPLPIDTPTPTSPAESTQDEEPVIVDVSDILVIDESLLPSRIDVTRSSDDLVLDALSSANASRDSTASATGVPTTPVDAAHAPPASVPSSSVGGSGGHAGEGARFHGDGFDPLQVWTRIPETRDDDLASSSVADTDVSPD